MDASELPKNELLRQRSVSELDIANRIPEEAFDNIVRLAVRLAGTPLAGFSVVDGETQIFKSAAGFAADATPRALSFCGHAILSSQILVVEDALEDERFRASPLVCAGPRIRFYAGVPVRSPAGFNVGALCVAGCEPRNFHPCERQELRDLARVLEGELLMRSLALRDRLTGLYNRESFRHIADRAWRQARSAGLSTSMIIVSLDHVRNGEHDAVESDALLRRISQCIQWTCNGTEYILARDRPNRFSLLVLNENRNSIRVLAESIRDNLEQAGLPHTGLAAGKLAVSVGASNSACPPKIDYSMTDLAERAQKAVQIAQGSRGSSVVLIPG